MKGKVLKHTTFANDIQRYRNKKKYSQKQLAKLLDIERSELSRIENGHYLPSEELVEKMAVVLDCIVSQLYSLETQNIIFKS